MADYKELLRRAVQALPENNGQARRAVYEKARAALVGQLRAITPPLAARDITTHRLQLEDCIRQVEQEASEAVIAGMQEPPPPPPKVPTTPAPKLETRAPGKPQPAPAEPLPSPGTIEEIIAASEITTATPQPVAAKSLPPNKVAAKPEQKTGAKPDLRLQAKLEGKQPAKSDAKEPGKEEGKPAAAPNGRAGRPLPSIVARAEAGRGKSSGAPSAFGIPPDKPYDGGRRGPTIEPRRESGPRLEPAARGQVAARQQVTEPMPFVVEPVITAAMSAVREVEVELEPEIEAQAVDPQGALDRAIAALDREARGEARPANGNVVELPRAEPEPELEAEATEEEAAEPVVTPAIGKRGANVPFREQTARGERERPSRKDRADRKARKPQRREARPRRDSAATEAAFQRPYAETERGGVSPLTIFLGVFAVLLVGAAAGGFWAWREGYIDLDSMFARSEPQAVAVAAADPVTTVAPAATPAAGAAATGPGNTATAQPDIAVAEPKVEERLTPSQPAPSVQPTVAPLALAPTPDAGKTEERLPVEGQAPAAQTAENAIAALDPANMAGSQSLLLEASDNGTTGAVPFSGTVDWSKGTDETGAPTLVAKASIPARNLSVDLLIRKNSDPSLPASHLMEINFSVSDSFIGGSVAGLPGVLLKNEELVQGAPLVGASARVVGNSFLFALSASAQDSAANNELLTTRKWMDLAVIYATGKRAIITLEKDEAAEQMFRDVFAEWGKTASTGQ